jgi:hypothetical protein
MTESAAVVTVRGRYTAGSAGRAADEADSWWGGAGAARAATRALVRRATPEERNGGRMLTRSSARCSRQAEEAS